jgi:hypothetical protein
LGQTDKALDIIAKLEQRQREEPGVVVDGDLLGVWWALGNKDKTLYYLERCVNKKMGPVAFFLAYPPMKGIADDPRAMELIEAAQKPTG